MRALDWPAVLQAVARLAQTTRGSVVAKDMALAASLDEVHDTYATLAEIQSLAEDDERLPLHGISDIRPLLALCAQGEALDPEPLIDIGTTLAGVERLATWCEFRLPEAPLLGERASAISLDPTLTETLLSSFDEDGELSTTRYPELAQLRRRISDLERQIRSNLDALLRSGQLTDVLQDSYVTERSGRAVVPVKASFKRGMGIVHGTSQSGETVFVEPASIVPLGNDKREAQAHLEIAERRILSQLTLQVAEAEPAIQHALTVVTDIDLLVARWRFGAEHDGVIPEVRDEGAIAMVAARHPVLVIRGIEVVANDLQLTADEPCLLLTGPNTGGKTIAMKTLGLSALMVRAGLPVLAAGSPRVDFFEGIEAMVGDLQAVDEDLSTFSGQVAVLQEVLERRLPGHLVLLDELGTGTDPAQGAALARAVVEHLVEAGARVVITTHFAELRALPESDPRYVVAAAEFSDGVPTFRIRRDRIGSSHAFEVAERLGLDPSVLWRARDLLAHEPLAEMMLRLDQQRAAVDAQAAELHELHAKHQQDEQKLLHRKQSLEVRKQRLDAEVRNEFGARARAWEADIKALIAALQANPNIKDAGDALATLRDIKQKARQKTNKPVPTAPPPNALQVGDRVQVHAMGSRGEVTALLADGRIEVDLGGMRMKVDKTALGLVAGRPRSRPLVTPPIAAPKGLQGTLRMDSNTCDLRGKRVEEGIDALEAFVDGLLRRGDQTGFVLHGHGTGAMKKAVREWAHQSPLVANHRPADEGEGGDAFTIVEFAGYD